MIRATGTKPWQRTRPLVILLLFTTTLLGYHTFYRYSNKVTILNIFKRMYVYIYNREIGQIRVTWNWFIIIRDMRSSVSTDGSHVAESRMTSS